MKIERETGTYNERRYGKPWIAVVSFTNNPQGEFTWGTWIGDPGDAGLLEIEAKPGDIVARGQKDFRNPKKSAASWHQVREDGGLTLLDGRAAALKAFRIAQGTEEDR